MIIQKAMDLYEFMDSWKKFEETKPHPKNAFYSKLSMKCISYKGYENAEQVLNTMKKRP